MTIWPATTIVLIVSPSPTADGTKAYGSRGQLFDGAVDGRRIVNIARYKDNSGRCAQLFDQEIGQQKMPEKIQLECPLKAVFRKLQRFCLHVESTGIENEAADGRNLHRRQYRRIA